MERPIGITTPQGVINNLVGTKSATAKAEFDARMPMLAAGGGTAAEVAKALYPSLYGNSNPPSQQVVDGIIYASKSVSAVSSFDDMFKSDDDISVGLGNLSNGKIEPDTFFLITAISLQYAVAAGVTDANVIESDYNLIFDYVRNGELSIEQNNRTILKNFLMEPFFKADQYVATGDTNASAGTDITYTMQGMGHVGMVRLANPKWLVPDYRIEVAMKFSHALASNAALRIILHGAYNRSL